MADLSEQIERAAGLPASTTLPDGTQYDEHNLKDLIAADNHLQKKEQGQSATGGMRLGRFVRKSEYGC